jgi:hypothetical protein
LRPQRNKGKIEPIDLAERYAESGGKLVLVHDRRLRICAGIVKPGYIRHVMEMRVRFPELLKRSGLTPYAVAKQSDDRISLSTAYRFNRSGGRLNTFDAAVLEALCDIFGVQPGELLERASRRRGR